MAEVDPVMPPPSGSPPAPSGFAAGLRAASRSIFAYVLFGNYIGIGALSHEFGFSPGWIVLSTVLVWAAPAQVILISTLGTATLFEVAVAVTLSSARFLPMVASLLPMLKRAETRNHEFLLPAHFTAISVWAESMRLLPAVPRERRIAFENGLGSGLMVSAVAASLVGYYLAAGLPPIFAAALLFLTPLSLLMSISRNIRVLIDGLAFSLGLVIGPLLAANKVKLDLLWTGIIAGTVAYLVHRLREAAR
jgi:predicted branched-subunit amino acid permease